MFGWNPVYQPVIPTCECSVEAPTFNIALRRIYRYQGELFLNMCSFTIQQVICDPGCQYVQISCNHVYVWLHHGFGLSYEQGYGLLFERNYDQDLFATVPSLQPSLAQYLVDKDDNPEVE